MQGSPWYWVLLVAALLTLDGAGFAQPSGQSPSPRPAGPSPTTTSDWTDRVQAAWKEAKETIQGKAPSLEQLKKLSAAELKALQAWEYRVVDLPARSADKLQVELVKLGEDGWECFAVTAITGTTEHGRYHFKRRKEGLLSYLALLKSIRQ
ncbi:MAG: hypothetical protein HY815_27620 [Candidatus Riflebacteria bacterium]|nr:hypothetical protein [Candidatus Riflebacteria bacterium]